MKRIITTIFFLTLLLSSCWNKNEEKKELPITNDKEKKELSISNDKEIINKIVIKKELYSKTTEVTFHDPLDIEKFEKDLKALNKEIESNTGVLSFEQVIDKARLLDYLWKTWEALELYVDNFENNMNDKSFVYNHNMARLYEKLESYDDALQRYWFLIRYFNKWEYYKDIANIWKKRWDEEKYKKAMTVYNKLMKKTNSGSVNTKSVETKEVKISADWVLEIK